MHLSPQERDKLLVHVAADVARRRLERGVRLNHPESVALITDHVIEGARDGRTVAELMSSGREVLRPLLTCENSKCDPTCTGRSPVLRTRSRSRDA